jgi:hypothetical protein
MSLNAAVAVVESLALPQDRLRNEGMLSFISDILGDFY